jgi:curved DNA-binding protein CbpA
MKLLTHDKPARPYSPDLYEVLGAHSSDDCASLRLKFKRLARLFHPDTSFQPNAADAFRRIQHAYSILSDPAKRSLYDKFGQEPISEELLAKEADACLHKLLEETFQGIKDNPDEAGFEYADILKAIRERVEQERSMLTGMLNVERALVRKLTKVVERTTRRGKDNVIALLTQDKINGSKATQFKMETTFLIWDRVVKNLESYDYKVPERPKPVYQDLGPRYMNVPGLGYVKV